MNDNWVVVWWNGSGGVEAGPYFSTFGRQHLTQYEAEVIAAHLKTYSTNGWHSRCYACREGEAFDLAVIK